MRARVVLEPSTDPYQVTCAMATVYTDGSCPRNPGGPGGWAWVTMGKKAAATRMFDAAGGYEPSTTSNRMELSAVLDVLRHFDPDEDLLIRSDSMYTINCISKWMDGWIRVNFTGKHLDKANQDIFWQVHEEKQRRRGKLTFEWVKGHVGGSKGNDMADRVAAWSRELQVERVLWVPTEQAAAEARHTFLKESAKVDPMRRYFEPLAAPIPGMNPAEILESIVGDNSGMNDGRWA